MAVDYTKKYLVPMSRKCDCEDDEHLVECTIKESSTARGGVIVTAIEAGFRTKFFIDNFFEWLLYTGYIKNKE